MYGLNHTRMDACGDAVGRLCEGLTGEMRRCRQRWCWRGTSGSVPWRGGRGYVQPAPPHCSCLCGTTRSCRCHMRCFPCKSLLSSCRSDCPPDAELRCVVMFPDRSSLENLTHRRTAGHTYEAGALRTVQVRAWELVPIRALARHRQRAQLRWWAAWAARSSGNKRAAAQAAGHARRHTLHTTLAAWCAQCRPAEATCFDRHICCIGVVLSFPSRQ